LQPDWPAIAVLTIKQEFYFLVKSEWLFLKIMPYDLHHSMSLPGGTMKVGLIGAGRIGRIHGANVAKRRDATLLYVADPDASAAQVLARETSAKVADIATILAAEVDAILICAPTDTHADLIERAARAGKAVFCEKPVDLSSERVQSCLAVVQRADIALMIGFNRRFDPNFSALKQRISDGAVGNVELLSIISRDPAPPPASYVARSGGLFRDMMIHDLDMARFLLDEEPTSVVAAGSAIVDGDIALAGDVDTAAVILETKSGKIVQISNSRRATYGYDQRIEVHGSKGMIRAGNIHETTIELADHTGFKADPVQNFFLERYAIAYQRELAAFIAAVTAGRKPIPSGHDGLQAQRLADAATQAWTSKKRVEV
jgi:myo-inositol 2-dehydrogenase/D-chiro-inositol 1-dehydrogenase